jgi:hypothetical protein
MEDDMVEYCVTLNSVLKALLAGGAEHCLNPGDFVVVKDFRRKSCKVPRWRGPYQVLLTNPTADRFLIQEKMGPRLFRWCSVALSRDAT